MRSETTVAHAATNTSPKATKKRDFKEVPQDQIGTVIERLEISDNEAADLDIMLKQLLSTDFAEKAVDAGVKYKNFKNLKTLLEVKKHFLKQICVKNFQSKEPSEFDWIDTITEEKYIDLLSKPLVLEHITKNYHSLSKLLFVNLSSKSDNPDPVQIIMQNFLNNKFGTREDLYITPEFLKKNIAFIYRLINEGIDPRTFGKDVEIDYASYYQAIDLQWFKKNRPTLHKALLASPEKLESLTYGRPTFFTALKNYCESWPKSDGTEILDDVVVNLYIGSILNLDDSVTFATRHRSKAQFISESDGHVRSEFGKHFDFLHGEPSRLSMNTCGFKFMLWYETTNKTWADLARTTYNHPLCAVGYGAHLSYEAAKYGLEMCTTHVRNYGGVYAATVLTVPVAMTCNFALKHYTGVDVLGSLRF